MRRGSSERSGQIAEKRENNRRGKYSAGHGGFNPTLKGALYKLPCMYK